MNASNMSVIGEKLKKTRESRSLTIEQVQKQTRIHSSVLIALEEGRCDKMLTPTYVKSFLKKYSSHLGLDVKELMDEYLSAHPELRSQESPPSTQIKADVSGRKGIDIEAVFRKARPWIAGLAVLSAIVLLVGGVTKFFADRNRVRIVMAPKSDSTKARNAKQANQKPAAKKSPAPAKDTAKNRVNPQKISEPFRHIPDNQPLNLVIKAKRDVFIGASADGETVFKKLLRKGASETIIADLSINLYIARAESTALTINGKTINAGKGLIKDLEITRKGARSK